MKLQHVVAGGFLIIDGSILIIRRLKTETSSQGYWEYPKGRVEWGERPETAVCREFFEETNLRVEPISIISTQSNTYNRAGNQIHMVVIEFLVRSQDGEIVSNIKLTEHDAYRWVSAQELAAVQPMYESVKQNLLAALK